MLSHVLANEVAFRIDDSTPERLDDVDLLEYKRKQIYEACAD